MNVYVVTNLINGKQYVGAEKRNNFEYFGSGRLIIEAIKEFGKENFKKEILVDNINNWDECLGIESQFIAGLNMTSNGYNQQIFAWPPSIEMSIKGGKITGERHKKLGIGIFAPENIGKGGKKTYELGIGLHAPGMAERGRKRARELKRGWFNSEVQRKNGKKAAETNKRQGTGFYDSKIQSMGGKVGGKMNAHIIVEMNGIFQQTTLGAVL